MKRFLKLSIFSALLGTILTLLSFTSGKQSEQVPIEQQFDHFERLYLGVNQVHDIQMFMPNLAFEASSLPLPQKSISNDQVLTRQFSTARDAIAANMQTSYNLLDGLALNLYDFSAENESFLSLREYGKRLANDEEAISWFMDYMEIPFKIFCKSVSMEYKNALIIDLNRALSFTNKYIYNPNQYHDENEEATKKGTYYYFPNTYGYFNAWLFRRMETDKIAPGLVKKILVRSIHLLRENLNTGPKKKFWRSIVNDEIIVDGTIKPDADSPGTVEINIYSAKVPNPQKISFKANSINIIARKKNGKSYYVLTNEDGDQYEFDPSGSLLKIK